MSDTAFEKLWGDRPWLLEEQLDKEMAEHWFNLGRAQPGKVGVSREDLDVTIRDIEWMSENGPGVSWSDDDEKRLERLRQALQGGEQCPECGLPKNTPSGPYCITCNRINGSA